MAILNAVTKKMRLEDNSIVIKKFIKGIEGGRALNIPADEVTTSEEDSKTITITKYVPNAILAGHVIVRLANGDYQPLLVKKTVEKQEGVADKVTEEYAELPDEAKYAGILVSSILKEKPAAAIMTWGIINENAVPYAIPEEAKAAMKYIDYQVDEVAK